MIVFVYTPLAVIVARMLWTSFRNRRRKRLILLAAAVPFLVAVPLADALWIDWKFNALEKNAGLRVTHRLAVDGYYDSKLQWDEAKLRKSGFRFMEYRDKDGTFRRIELTEKGSRTFKIPQPTARYHWVAVSDRKPVAYRIDESEDQVVDSLTGAVFGRNIIYSSYPGWVDRLWWPYVKLVWASYPEGKQVKFLPRAVFVGKAQSLRLGAI
ncbi:MAG: hypothetical protein ACYC2R_00060 [Burkholderiales bacterium]|nr:hypothetical protein [Sulfuricellaceae bacterium]